MTSPSSFYVRICSICGKRVNGESNKTDDNGHAIHEECGPSRGQSSKSEGQSTRQTSSDIHES